MTKRAGAVCLLLLISASSGCALRRGDTAAAVGNWNAVTSLPRGTRVTVELDGGLFRIGALQWADLHQVVIGDATGTAAVPRADVARLFLRGRTRGERAGRGFLVGAAAGVAGAMYFTGHLGFGLRIGATWGAIGAGIGASMGDDHPGRLLYVRQPGKV
ncbi:MAG TPA: hypothetical protein VM364_13765 [Vicinamibacterales bacterium]|nr:hypothetical protein [Vicinamibacterales bacterium]